MQDMQDDQSVREMELSSVTEERREVQDSGAISGPYEEEGNGKAGQRNRGGRGLKHGVCQSRIVQRRVGTSESQSRLSMTAGGDDRCRRVGKWTSSGPSRVAERKRDVLAVRRHSVSTLGTLRTRSRLAACRG